MYFYQDGELRLGTTAQSQTVKSFIPNYEGPTYVYDLDDIKMRFEKYDQAFSGLKHTVHYAMKANSHPLILRTLANAGAGVDTVSAGEVKKALAAGFKPEKIILSGVAKTKKEIEYAVDHKIKQINIESPAELARIIEIAKKKNTLTNVAFRLNPDVNPQTHPYITTGFRENKFGMDESFLSELVTLLKGSREYVKLRGLTMHIGSLLFDLDVFMEAMEKTLAVHRTIEAEGFELDRFDVGGGLGIKYETENPEQELKMLETYGMRLKATLKSLPATTEILAEPGRMIVGRSGVLVSEVQYIKKAPAKTFAIVDTGMHHLLRPALYQAKHRVLPLSQTKGKQQYDVVGPICESSDVLAKNVDLPEMKEGDLIAMADAGAYGFSMANTYNSHDLPREIVVEGGRIVS